MLKNDQRLHLFISKVPVLCFLAEGHEAGWSSLPLFPVCLYTQAVGDRAAVLTTLMMSEERLGRKEMEAFTMYELVFLSQGDNRMQCTPRKELVHHRFQDAFPYAWKKNGTILYFIYINILAPSQNTSLDLC